MHILVCGDTGFIGGHISRQLRAAGHQVSGLKSAPALDFTRALDPADWQARLAGINAVVNAVGILKDSARRPMAAIHTQAPLALFEACALAGIRRVVQISALGVDQMDTAYARTKRAADEGLLALAADGRLDAAILRPSVVYGPGGEGSTMFMRLARLPLLVMPGIALHSRLQPVAVTDIAAAVLNLLSGEARDRTGMFAAVGPRQLSLGDFIQSLRAQLGHGPARQIGLPDCWSIAMARAGDWLPPSPFTSDTLAMLRVPNVADPAATAAFAGLLGRPAVAPDEMVARVWRAQAA